VLSRNLDGVGLLAPSKEANFSMDLSERRSSDSGMTREVKTDMTRTELRFIDLRISEPKEDK